MRGRIAGTALAEGGVTVALGFDELRIDLQISYPGRSLDLAATPPTAEELWPMTMRRARSSPAT